MTAATSFIDISSCASQRINLKNVRRLTTEPELLDRHFVSTAAGHVEANILW